MPVTVRILIFLVGNPYKPLFATVTGGTTQSKSHQRFWLQSGKINIAMAVFSGPGMNIGDIPAMLVDPRVIRSSYAFISTTDLLSKRRYCISILSGVFGIEFCYNEV